MQPGHPGELLREELAAFRLSANDLPRAPDVQGNRITRILAGQRGVCPDNALRPARSSMTTSQLWMSLQKT